MERVLAVVQSLDPPGVGARDLKSASCFRRGPQGAAMSCSRSLTGTWTTLAAGRYRKIAKAVCVSVKEVMEARDVLLTLDPKPGARYSSESVR